MGVAAKENVGSKRLNLRRVFAAGAAGDQGSRPAVGQHQGNNIGRGSIVVRGDGQRRLHPTTSGRRGILESKFNDICSKFSLCLRLLHCIRCIISPTRSLVPSVSYSSGLSSNPDPLAAPPGGGSTLLRTCVSWPLSSSAPPIRYANRLNTSSSSAAASSFSLSTVVGLTSPRTAAIILVTSDSLTPE